MEYVGADMSVGPEVDILLNLHEIDLPSESVGTVISCDTLELVEFPRRAMAELHRILKPNGILILTTVMNYPIHAAPNDYWRYTPEGMRSLFSGFESTYIDWNGLETNSHTVVGVGIKGKYSFEKLSASRREWRTDRDISFSHKIFTLIISAKKNTEKCSDEYLNFLVTGFLYMF